MVSCSVAVSGLEKLGTDLWGVKDSSFCLSFCIVQGYLLDVSVD